jgi:hypothetical protein
VIKLRKLIREMIMSEAYEHTDDEVVTFDNIDLQYEYDKLNQSLFNGELETVPLSWANTKGKHGSVKFRAANLGRNARKVNSITGLFLSKYFKIPYKMFKDTLAHEMIHVKNLQDVMRSNRVMYKNEGHGVDFIREMNRINAMGLGFKISITGEENYDVADHVKGREMYVGVLKITGSKNGTFIIAMTPSAYAQKEQMEGIFSRANYNSVAIDYYKTNNPYFLKFSTQRNFNRNVSYSVATDIDLQKVEELGQFLGSYKYGDTPTADREPVKTYTAPKAENPIAASQPTSRFAPIPEPKPESKPEVSNEIKSVNRQIMSIYKSITDKSVQEKLFDILKTDDAIKKQMKIDNYNQSLGPKYGFIEE